MGIEEYFISTFCTTNSLIGDDGAVVDTKIYSKDLFYENIHFKRSWLSMYQIGYKAMTVNISDAIAMNAVPKYALLGIGMNKSMTREDISELSRGLREAASEYNVVIIGGDTIENIKLDISITIISESDTPLYRNGLKYGDIIAFTGELGKSSRDLRYLLSGGKVHNNSRFVRPTLRQRFIKLSRRSIRCGMDISDGLFSDIGKLSRLNKKGISFLKKIPKRVGCSGEEYEMLIAFSPTKLKGLHRIAAQSRTPITTVARVIRGKYTNRCKSHHF